ncbi:hypothetical protein [Paenibacillus glycanilyticus]|uniref:Uncharacterized protein n=1 Tax=Paenibacillus glycanilyticus TaxID=126569 RepID=A0ABQ6GBQ2_9BACL|nr:hypothetical protein [Paenibacillus glycanilyticus]GLX67685.1 hypothetical protein MU1_20300 [Paenibacillus glycanilyticus]
MEHIHNRLYTAYGLRLASEMELPELMTAMDDGSEPDAWITFADLSEFTANWQPGKKYIADDEKVLIYEPNVAFYCVKHNQIQVMPIKQTEAGQYRLTIIRICCSMLLVRREIAPINAGGVVINGKAYAVIADYGTGQLALEAFMEAGYKLLGDEILAIAMNGKTNELTAYPGYPVAKMFHNEPLPLAGVLEIERANTHQISISQITLLQRVQLFRNQSYLQLILREMNLEKWLFTFATRVALSIPFYQIKQPLIGYSEQRLVHQILYAVSEKEIVSGML